MIRLSILLAACVINLPSNALAERPNVVILFTDDQGTIDANCYGSTDLYTPHIDKLAATGVRFTQAYAHTVCCPARAMLLTGRHPQRSGVHFWTQGDMNAAKGINMALEEVTLAEALKAAGYRTALYGKWHLGAHRDYGPKKQGFDEFFGIRDGFIDNYNHYFLLPIIESNRAKSHYDTLHWQWGNRWAVRQREWKLLGRDDKGLSLHNLNDPQPEKKNYLKDKPELAARLLMLHNAWAKDVQPKQAGKGN